MFVTLKQRINNIFLNSKVIYISLIRQVVFLAYSSCYIFSVSVFGFRLVTERRRLKQLSKDFFLKNCLLKVLVKQ